MSIVNLKDGVESEKFNLTMKPYVYRDYIPPRKIISIGGMKCYAKGFLSVTGAAGGVGKSSLAIAEELSLVYGVDLLAHLPVPHLEYPPLKCGRQRVWSMCLEDDEEEHQRRVNAALMHYKLDPSALDGWYFVTYKSDSPVSVGSIGKDGFITSPQVIQIQSAIEDNQIDILNVDPFVNSHSVPENDNGAMNKVADIWRSICQRMGVASNLTHHIRKMSGMNEVSSDDLRGAVSVVGAARLVRVLAPMNKDEAAGFGIAEERRRFYIWVNPGAKANIVPPANARHWFHLASVDLGNAEDGWESDSIGVMEYWQPPTDKVINQSDAHASLYAALVGKDDAYKIKNCRTNSQSDGWIGNLIGNLLKIELNDQNKKSLKSLIKKLENSGALTEDTLLDDKSRKKDCYQVVKPSNWEDSDDAF
ncbi:AAA family ATPase [Polynucleobacter yangtzensis]|uniref:Uncharacterized protein n=1 Tax=Polynucleobacter yangtzensis TaxID=1743159 RepID=A0ABN6TUM9_9BURK|nr:AAA family ATPase [Polynucleobacter yangtzensis]BDT79227.1 hypothetical protein PKF032_11150 [Polynucleobacter yangtzensis]